MKFENSISNDSLSVLLQPLLLPSSPCPRVTTSHSCVSEPCCAYTLQRASWLLPIVDHGVDNDEEENPFDGLYCARVRQQIWNCFENPHSSKAAKVRHCFEIICPLNMCKTSSKVLVIVSSLFLLASICMLILSTIPEFQVRLVMGTFQIIC